MLYTMATFVTWLFYSVELGQSNNRSTEQLAVRSLIPDLVFTEYRILFPR